MLLGQQVVEHTQRLHPQVCRRLEFAVAWPVLPPKAVRSRLHPNPGFCHMSSCTSRNRHPRLFAEGLVQQRHGLSEMVWIKFQTPNFGKSFITIAPTRLKLAFVLSPTFWDDVMFTLHGQNPSIAQHVLSV